METSFINMDTSAEKIRRHAKLALLDDGKVDKQELQHLLDIAIEDGVVTVDEQNELKRVMDEIIAADPELEVAGLVHRIRLVLKL